MNKLQVKEELILNSDNGNKYHIVVINVNDFREPSLKYCADVSIPETGFTMVEEFFFGDDWVKENFEKLEFLGVRK